MFRHYKPNTRKPKLQIQSPNITLAQMTLSGLIGLVAAYMKSGENKKDWFFGLAIGGLVTTVCLAGSYIYSRFTSLNSIPKIEFDSKSKSNDKLIPISNAHMSKVSPEELNDGSLYYMAFCFKRGFADLLEGGYISKYVMEKSPFKHSSVMFIPVDIMSNLRFLPTNMHDAYLSKQKGIFVCGRQSPIYRETNNIGFLNSPREERTKTKIDNEGLYELFPGASFESMLTDSIFSGKEIKAIIQRVDNLICNNKDQFCDMINSNCYSGSICMLAIAIETLFERHKDHLKMIGSSIAFEMHPFASQYVDHQLKSLCSILTEVVQHNKGQGVINNELVFKEINKALEIASIFDKDRSETLTRNDLGKLEYHVETCEISIIRNI